MMRKFFGGYPPRYLQLLKVTLAAALVRLVPLVPFVLVFYLPLGPWFKLLLVACPVLWAMLVCPARVRYARIVAAFAGDGAAPLTARDLLNRDAAWWDVCRGRVRRMRWYALPLVILIMFFLVLLWFVDVFSVTAILLGSFSWIAGIAGGVILWAVVWIASLVLFGWGAFRTGAYRFGAEGVPKAGGMKPLLKSNLRLWLPTLLMLVAFLLLTYKELGLLFANIVSAAPVFTVKLSVPQIVLAALTGLSYLLLLPLRRLNTAVWTQNHAGELGMRN